MLTVDEIKKFIDDDKTSEKKRFAKVGERYYDGDNDIKQYRLFYYNADGNLVEDNGDVDIKTVDVPYQARKEKMELDEKNIYRFGMGLNTAGLKDTNATTNIAIKAAYSLLELQCNKLEIRLKKLLRHLVRIVIEEINKTEQKGYQDSDVCHSTSFRLKELC